MRIHINPILLATLTLLLQSGIALADDHDHDHDGEEEEEHHDEEMEDSSHGHKPWGSALGAAMLVNVAALVGVITLIPSVVKAGRLVRFGRYVNIGVPAFAVGALVSTSVFLIFPESVEMLEVLYADVSDDDGKMQKVALHFGSSFLAGFLLPTVLGAMFHKESVDGNEFSLPSPNSEVSITADRAKVENDTVSITAGVATVDHCDVCCETPSCEHEVYNDDNRKDTSPVDEECAIVDTPCKDCNSTSPVKKTRFFDLWKTTPFDDVATVVNKRLCATILIGDAFHNISDGIFIGTAFQLCSGTTAWAVVLATLYHEMAQELADFFVLTRMGGLSTLMALLLNFCSGISVIIGAAVILLINISDGVVASILTIAGGVYIHIAMESMNQVEKHCAVASDRIFSLLAILSGVAPIMYITSLHGHCEGSHDH